MAEYLIQDTTLTGLGDKVRAVTGTTATMTPAAMQSDLETFNTDMATVVSEQDILINDIAFVLQNKAATPVDTTAKIVIVRDASAGWSSVTSITYNGTTYSSLYSLPGTEASSGTYGMLDVEIGDFIKITSSVGGYVLVNDTEVASAESGTAMSYNYKVVSDAVFTVGGYTQEGYVRITEI